MPSSRKRVPQLAAMTKRQREVYEKGLHAVSLSRLRRLPLKTAAPQAHTTEAAGLRYVGSAFTRRHGEWVAKPRDTLERQLLLYRETGSYHVTVRSSTTASRIGAYHNSMRQFLETGDRSKLQRFEGKFVVDVEGRRHYFMTDPDTILRLARAKEFGFESIY